MAQGPLSPVGDHWLAQGQQKSVGNSVPKKVGAQIAGKQEQSQEKPNPVWFLDLAESRATRLASLVSQGMDIYFWS